MARAELDELNVRLIAGAHATCSAPRCSSTSPAPCSATAWPTCTRTATSASSTSSSALRDFTEIDTQIDYFRQISQADTNTVAGIEDAHPRRRPARADQSRTTAPAALATRDGPARASSADVEDQLAQRKALLADSTVASRQLLEQQARLDAAASRAPRPPPASTSAASTARAAQIALVKETMKYLGIPYVWAGATPSGGFDCSGLVLYVYAKFGVAFPHGATMQAHMGTPVPFDQLQPADLVFFGDAQLLPPRRHLHRQRPLHRGAAHRRRGQGQPARRPRRHAGLPLPHPRL